MSIAVGPADYGMLGKLIANASSVKQKLDTLTNQASTGLIGDTYAGLGTGASISLDLRPQMANVQTWQNNVDASTGRMAVTQSAMANIQSIAASFYAQLNTVDGVNASAVDSIAASARDALSQVASQLDTQNGGVYVFAGQDTGNPPVPDPDKILTSGFYTQINAAVGRSCRQRRRGDGTGDLGHTSPDCRTAPARRHSHPICRNSSPCCRPSYPRYRSVRTTPRRSACWRVPTR